MSDSKHELKAMVKQRTQAILALQEENNSYKAANAKMMQVTKIMASALESISQCDVGHSSKTQAQEAINKIESIINGPQAS